MLGEVRLNLSVKRLDHKNTVYSVPLFPYQSQMIVRAVKAEPAVACLVQRSSVTFPSEEGLSVMRMRKQPQKPTGFSACTSFC